MAGTATEHRLRGVWALESWRGAVSAPYTDRPLGRIIYEPGARDLLVRRPSPPAGDMR